MISATDKTAYRQVLDQAKRAAELAYCPYSNYPVGAALLAFDGQIYSGCNVENCGYTQTIHAEQTAMAKAISEGALERARQAGLSQIQFIEAIAIYAPKGSDSWPCCNCRQSLNEFGLDTKVIGEHADGSIDSMTLGELIPHAFPMEVVLAAAHGQNWHSTVAKADADTSKGGKRRRLIDAARQASTLSYSPYSDYPVGAAIQTFDDQIYTGCNIENCGYTQTIHAEQTAITKAISEGALHRALRAGLKQSEVFKSIALYSPKGTSWPSCNGRQALSEFGLKMQVIKEGKNGDIVQKSLKDLIPNAFPVETVLSSIRAARANTSK